MNSQILTSLLIQAHELGELNSREEFDLCAEIVDVLLENINTSAGLHGEEKIRLAVYENGKCTLINHKTLTPYK